MADLLTASGGQLVMEPGTTLAAQFDCPERALTAARRLQRALYAFTATPETAGFAATVVIHGPEDTFPQQPELSVPVLLWSEFSAAGQILVTARAHETLQLIPGVESREIGDSGGGSASLYREILWIDPESLKSWQARVAEASQPISSGEQDRKLDATAPYSEVISPEFPVPDVAEPHPESGMARYGRKKLLMIAGAVTLLAAVVILVAVFRSKSARPIPANGPQVVNQEQPAVAPQSGAQSSPSATSAPAVTERKPVEDTKAPRATRSKPHSQQNETGGGLAQYEGFTARQIPQLLRRAEADAGAGNYDAAKREYQIILALQPGNAEAKEGLRKLNLKMGQR